MTTNGKKIRNYFSHSLLSRKVSDRELDRLIFESIKPLYARAVEKTLLNPSDSIRSPRLIKGMVRTNQNGVAEFNIKSGKDGFVRYVPLAITIMNFTQHEILIYQCIYNPITETALNESTWTYYYKHVASIGVKVESRTKESFTFLQKKLHKIPLVKPFVHGERQTVNTSKTFVLKTTGGDALEVRLADYEIIESIGGAFNTTETEEVINSIRTVLNEMKRN